MKSDVTRSKVQGPTGDQCSHTSRSLRVLYNCVDLLPLCCNRIKVQGGGRAKEKQGRIFTTYTKDSDLVHGRVAYTSQDGTRAIAFNEDHKEWKIQPVANR